MGGRCPGAWSTRVMSVGLSVCVGVYTFVMCALGGVIWALVSLYLKAVAPCCWSKSDCFG